MIETSPTSYAAGQPFSRASVELSVNSSDEIPNLQSPIQRNSGTPPRQRPLRSSMLAPALTRVRRASATAAPNQRIKVSCRGGRLNGSLLIAAAAPRSLCAIRWVAEQ